MPGISVRFVWRPRHTPSGTRYRNKCFDYAGHLSFDACVIFVVDLDQEDRDATYRSSVGASAPSRQKYSLFLHQVISITGTFKSNDVCFLIPTKRDEYFSVNSRGASPQDYHHMGVSIFGPVCPLPCIEDATVESTVEIIKTQQPIALPGSEEFYHGPDDKPYKVQSYDKQPNNVHSGYYATAESPAASILLAAKDEKGTHEAEAKYGKLHYGYKVHIDHCPDVSQAVQETIAPGTTLLDPSGRVRNLSGGSGYRGPDHMAPSTPPSAEVPRSDWQQRESGGGKGGKSEIPYFGSNLILPFGSNSDPAVAGSDLAAHWSEAWLTNSRGLIKPVGATPRRLESPRVAW